MTLRLTFLVPAFGTGVDANGQTGRLVAPGHRCKVEPGLFDPDPLQPHRQRSGAAVARQLRTGGVGRDAVGAAQGCRGLTDATYVRGLAKGQGIAVMCGFPMSERATLTGAAHLRNRGWEFSCVWPDAREVGHQRLHIFLRLHTLR